MCECDIQIQLSDSEVLPTCDQGCFGHPFILEPFDFAEDLRSIRLLPIPTLQVEHESEDDTHDERLVGLIGRFDPKH